MRVISGKRILAIVTGLLALVLGAAAPAAGQEKTTKEKHALPTQGASPPRAATSMR